MKPHRFDPISFVLGLMFLVVALAFLGGERSVADIGEVWLWALPVSAVGLLIVAYGLRRALQREEEPSLPDRFGRADGEE